MQSQSEDPAGLSNCSDKKEKKNISKNEKNLWHPDMKFWGNVHMYICIFKNIFLKPFGQNQGIWKTLHGDFQKTT